MTVRLHVNIDHVATLRKARGASYPDPAYAAVLAELAGADGITVHLREDRRHIEDRDVEVLRGIVKTTLNLEMAATEEMLAIALRVKPDMVTLVPERREERTTEGGLRVCGAERELCPIIEQLGRAGIVVSLFIDPDGDTVLASHRVGAQVVEFHTGEYALASEWKRHEELRRIEEAASFARQHARALRVAAGHGLTQRNVPLLLERVSEIEELNIGHALISDAVFVGLEAAVRAYRGAIDRGTRARHAEQAR